VQTNNCIFFLSFVVSSQLYRNTSKYSTRWADKIHEPTNQSLTRNIGKYQIGVKYSGPYFMWIPHKRIKYRYIVYGTVSWAKCCPNLLHFVVCKDIFSQHYVRMFDTLINDGLNTYHVCSVSYSYFILVYVGGWKDVWYLRCVYVFISNISWITPPSSSSLLVN
jgi:hypothetical protein